MLEKVLARMFGKFGDVNYVPPDAMSLLRGLKEIRVGCDVRLKSSRREHVIKSKTLEWSIACQVKGAGLSVVDDGDAPCLWSRIELVWEPNRKVYVLCLQSRLSKTGCSFDASKASINAGTLWRGVSVCAVTSERRLWYDVCGALSGQVGQFLNECHICRRVEN